MAKKKKKLKVKNIIILGLLSISLGVLIVSSKEIIKWFNDNKKSESIMDNIENKITITQEENIDTVITQNEEEIDESDPYWDFINMNLIDVNIAKLKEDNPDTVGWLSVSGTNINYPFVHTTDNKYYLTHDFYKANNGGGWVFLDYRNNANLDGRNNIIYAHGRENGSMFGSLKNILSSQWVNNSQNYVVQISTMNVNSLWQVFSIYKIPNTNDYIQTDFSSDKEFNYFAKKLLERSNFNFKTTVNEKDKILTLSTCYNDDEKVVLHAKLIKTN